MTKFTTFALAATTALTLGSVASATTDSKLKNAFVLDSEETIVGNAMMVRNLTTLVDAVSAAGLVPTLSGDGPFTVFAPMNSAFSELGADAVSDLLKPENQAALVDVLQLHVVEGEIDTSKIASLFDGDDAIPTDLLASQYEIGENPAGDRVVRLRTIGNQFITISENGGDYYLDKNATDSAEVVVADIETSNGVLHIIDGVIVR